MLAGLRMAKVGAATTGDNYFYTVRSVDACGRETP